MARKSESLFAQFCQLPWWVSICLMVVVYLGIRFGIPLATQGKAIFQETGRILSRFAWVAIIFLLPAAFSILDSYRKRKMLDRQTGIDSIRGLSWKEFEELLAEAYRRQGFSVQENASRGSDGGIDLRIQRSSTLYLVQCKQWRSSKVGVNVVREMFGILVAKGAAGAVIVTSGSFTQEARAFARGKPLNLIEGNQLAELIGSVQRPRSVTKDSKIVNAPDRCPHCGRPLVLREARRGSHAGNKFWGCSGFPVCRYIFEGANCSAPIIRPGRKTSDVPGREGDGEWS